MSRLTCSLTLLAFVLVPGLPPLQRSDAGPHLPGGVILRKGGGCGIKAAAAIKWAKA
jgi:hypothetical protein